MYGNTYSNYAHKHNIEILLDNTTISSVMQVMNQSGIFLKTLKCIKIMITDIVHSLFTLNLKCMNENSNV